MAYTTQAKVLQYLGLSALPSPLTSVADYIAAVTALINKYTGRTFEEGTSEDREYDGDGSSSLLIDDATEITAIKIYDDTGNLLFTLTTDDYVLYPENKTTKDKIQLREGSQVSRFERGHQNIKVTGKFGFSSSIPADVELAATQLVSAIVQDNYLNTSSNVKSESLGEYSVTYNDVNKAANKLGVYDILDNYREIAV